MFLPILPPSREMQSTLGLRVSTLPNPLLGLHLELCTITTSGQV